MNRPRPGIDPVAEAVSSVGRASQPDRSGWEARPAGETPAPGVYLDHNATTPLAPEVIDVLVRHVGTFGNPSSQHRAGEEARELVDWARARVAGLVNAAPEEIVFTGSGSEADNLAVKGVAFGPSPRRGQGKPRGFCPLTRAAFRLWDRLLARLRGPVHVITSQIEHSAVLASCRFLEQLGHRVSYVPVGGGGRVDPDEVRRHLRPDTRLISVMHANNEIGVLQPVEEIAAVAREAGVLFHTDACQTAGKVPIDLARLPADLVALSAQKLYGPKGVGALVVRGGAALEPVIHGGGQEHGLRAGTENVLGILGLGKACELAARAPGAECDRQRGLRDRLLQGLLALGDVRVNGDVRFLLPGTLNVSFRDVRGDALATALALEGIAVSTGSACHAGKHSHVLQALGLGADWLHGAVRFSLGRGTTEEEIDRVLEVVPRLVARLRRGSPLAPASQGGKRMGSPGVVLAGPVPG
jgi:cysteine desulfurase